MEEVRTVLANLMAAWLLLHQAMFGPWNKWKIGGREAGRQAGKQGLSGRIDLCTNGPRVELSYELCTLGRYLE